VNLLLDTHAFLWWRLNDRRLKSEARRAIATSEQVRVSAASAWEVAIKAALGRLHLADPFATLVERSGFDPLPITFAHAARVATLPNHHADPFDRMLVAQAQDEGLAIVTHDRAFEPYAVPVVWT
jgi:PIN domain nuclease of toxin-antitoxin system